MGDGGVVFMPSQHVMERLEISDTSCRGNGGFSLKKKKSIQFSESQQLQQKHEKKMDTEKEEFGSQSVRDGEIENGEIVPEVEEGELRMEKDVKVEVENGEFLPDSIPRREVERWRRGREIEKGEYVQEKRQRGELEKGELNRRGCRGEIEKGEIVQDKWRKQGLEKLDFVHGRGRKGEVENGGFVSSKFKKREVGKEELGKEKGWAYCREGSPPSMRYADEDAFYQKKEFNRNGGNEWRKKSLVWVPPHNKESKTSSRAVEDELGSVKHENNDGKNYRKESSSNSWLKRPGAESGNISHRYNSDFIDYSSSRSRKVSGDGNHSGFPEKHHSRPSLERSYRNNSSACMPSLNRYNPRHGDPLLPSRRQQDRHACYVESSPRELARYHDHRDRSPTHFEMSPHHQARHHDYRNRSPVHHRSPQVRGRHYERRDRTPGYSERSSLDREHSPHARSRRRNRRDLTPGYLDRSPHDRDQSPYASSRYHDHRNQIPGHLERSPLDSDQSPRFQARRHDRRDQTPGYLERSPLVGRSHDQGEACRKSEGTETKHTQDGSPVGDGKLGQIGSTGREPCEHSSSKQLNNISNLDKNSGSIESNADAQLKTEEQLMDVTLNSTELPQVIEAPEELLSMEEDMDISDTPPHVSVMADSTSGAWFYLDHFGMEQGPSKLSDLKRLVEEGVLQSDHLIKHSASEWWLTVENAASPSLPANFSSIVSDSVTQLVSPPEAPGNLLSDIGDAGLSAYPLDQEQSVALSQLPTQSDNSSIALGDSEDLHIDDRVAALLEGYTFTPGRELETVGEALHMTFEFKEWERWINSEGFTSSRPSPDEQCRDRRDEEISRSSDSMSKEVAETRSNALYNREFGFPGYGSDWFSGRWSCKGGDWKRNDEAAEDRHFRRKFVLNDGFHLCQMPKSGYEDPRWSRKDELYYPSRVRRLSLPPWAFSVSEERTDCNGANRSNQIKLPMVLRGVKGTVLPVVRINTCVVSDHIPSIGESRMTVRGYERHSSRSIRPHSSSSDGRITGAEGVSQSERTNEKDLQGLKQCIQPVIIPKDRVCSIDDLQLHLGDWYHVDGAGHEHGPSSFSELQVLIEKGTIQKHTSVFRKLDNIWVPVSYAVLGSKAAECSQDKKVSPIADSSKVPLSQSDVTMHGAPLGSSSFHSLHPQFIGYTRGKLHELVMKSYKSREFTAAINEVLDPWINAKQPKKDLEKHSHDVMQKFRRSEDDYIRSGKRIRLLADESEDEYDLEVDLLRGQKDDCLFEDVCGDATFSQAENMNTEAEMESWGLLNGNILARIFHFLRTDMRSLAFSAATCKHWNAAVKFYRDISKQVDLSEAGPYCTDSMFHKIMNSYDKMKITSIILVGCTNISAGTLEEVLLSLPCISSVNIGGCSQFGELSQKLPNIKWIKYCSLRETGTLDESSSKIKSLKQIADRSIPFSKAYKGSNSHSRGYSNSGDVHSHDALTCRDSEIRSFRQGFYKRKKLLDARRSSSLLSREARMRRWLYRKPENGYKRLEEFITLSLKYIMKDNAYDFFIPKVAEIEEKMKNGYYMDNGLVSIKEDIKRMCRDAIKAKSRAEARDMNHVIMLFIQLVKNLEENSKSSLERDEMMMMLKDSPSAGFCSAASRIKKKHIKSTNERKSMNRSNGSIYGNGTSSYGDYATDSEIKRRLSKLNKRTLDSESETSDDSERSSEDASRDGDSTASDTESDPELYAEIGMSNHRRDDYLLDDHSLDSISEDREWGARMTKASLVPPVTRKYEVIDQYVIIADEEEVQRKMCVALPEDYAEKINAQKTGVEESDLELPEVKDYKPRKQLGEEVLEQEVYGIDPYTHNLLLDSMPDELDWPLLEKHLFIEDALLRTLNTQVRHFTGTGNAPMKYPLQPVVEEIQRNAEENSDRRIIKMCQGILKAIRSRPEDNYVSYRKGLGVVCNREEGFGREDFVVEFLGEVYPVWKWFEKQDGIRSLQKNSKDPAPEFYNIYLERPKGDQDGYDLVVVDAMHKANYASRICHSCRPNCEAKVTAVDGQYQIGVYSVRPIGYGEEITFDYNSVTESKEEYEASVCLCGSQICRGSYLNLTGEGAYQKVISECHGILDRHRLMLEACQLNFVSEEDYIDLGKAGLGTCLLAGLPDWLIAYTARLVRFINFERTKLPEEILRHNVEEKKKFFLDICHDVERSEAEVQAEGVYNQRLQNLALTLDKVRYVMRSVYTDAKKAAPPLQKLSPAEVVSFLWKGEGSLVEELLKCMALHMEDHMLRELKSKIRDHDPSGSDDLIGELRKSLIWLRDEVRDLPCTYKCRHDAAADLIHIYAYTKCFFRVQPYKTVTSPPVYISPLDLGPKYLDKLGSGFKEYCKTYAENYCLGQLIYWHSQNNADPDRVLIRARRGCLLLPDIASFYAKANMSSKQRVYGPRTLRFMLSRMEKQPQRPWPKERIWSFKSTAEIFGSPMLDALLNKTALDRDMMHWLKNRPSIFYATGDR